MFVILGLVRAGMNLIFKYMWNLIINRNKEYLANQLHTLTQNAEQKEKQLKDMQLSAKEQIGMEVRKAIKSIVADLAKKNVLSLSKEIVPQVVDMTISDISLLKSISHLNQFFSTVLDWDSDSFITMECASNEALDILMASRSPDKTSEFRSLIQWRNYKLEKKKR